MKWYEWRCPVCKTIICTLSQEQLDKAVKKHRCRVKKAKGHKQYYPQESDIEKANRLAREAEEKAERLRRCVDHKKDIIKHREYQVRHFKGEVTKLKKAGKGAT